MHQLVRDAVSAAPAAAWAALLAGPVVCAGGLSQLPGLRRRLERELEALGDAPRRVAEVRILRRLTARRSARF